MCTDLDGAAQRARAAGADRTPGSSGGQRALENAERQRRSAGARRPPFVVAIVGPAGSGKSMLARSLAGPGARVLDADRFGHEITDGDPTVRAALAAEYGPAVYRPDGSLDRARVAARVFSDPSALARLNGLVHPRILARLRAEIAAAADLDTVIVDAALLLDWGFERECDAVVAVVAPRALQLERLRRARGWSEEEANRRLSTARTNESFTALADEVVVNDRDEAAGIQAMRAAVARLRARWAKP
jgi:dephospho-CoA kinase